MEVFSLLHAFFCLFSLTESCWCSEVLLSPLSWTPLDLSPVYVVSFSPLSRQAQPPASATPARQRLSLMQPVSPLQSLYARPARSIPYERLLLVKKKTPQTDSFSHVLRVQAGYSSFFFFPRVNNSFNKSPLSHPSLMQKRPGTKFFGLQENFPLSPPGLRWRSESLNVITGPFTFPGGVRIRSPPLPGM